MGKTSSPSNASDSTVLGWKFVGIFGVLGAIFLTFFYLAMSNEPDYMPSQQHKYKTAPVISSEAMSPQSKTSAPEHSQHEHAQ